MSIRAVHWAGGVEFPTTDGGVTSCLPGWPCCCSGDRCRKIACEPARMTRRPARVTCKRCLGRMRKDDRAAGWGLLAGGAS